MDGKRPPDPMHPDEIPDTLPGDSVGRPAIAVLGAILVVAVAIALMVWAVVD
jgi:hypothetical protein